MMSPMPPIYDEIRQSIAASPQSRYRLWQETGISQGHLSEFMAGTKGLSVESLEILADHLNLHIITRPKQAKSTRTKNPRNTPRKGR